jgi:hypothetical protein
VFRFDSSTNSKREFPHNTHRKLNALNGCYFVKIESKRFKSTDFVTTKRTPNSIFPDVKHGACAKSL